MNLWGKVAVLTLIGSGVIAAGGLWWTANNAYWSEDPEAVIALSQSDGTSVRLEVAELQAIRASSSPLGFRACFRLPDVDRLDQTLLQQMDRPAPRIPPRWFTCFDPGDIANALKTGRAVVYLGEKNIAYGVDRVVAIFDDGRGFAWHELNDCGRKAYDGSPVGEACPDRATYEGGF